MRTKNLSNHGQVLNLVFTFFVILAFSSVMLKAQAPPPSCSLSCNNGVNMSVDVVMDADGNCAAELTVATFSQGCDAAVGYAILIEHGTETIFDSRISGPVTLGLLDPVQWLEAGDFIKKNVTYKILALDGDKAILNTCWGNMLVEDKAPPALTAGDDIAVECCAVSNFVPPTAADCSGLDEVKVVSERTITDCAVLSGLVAIPDGSGTILDGSEALPDGTILDANLFVKILIREYIATDKCGNTTPNPVTKRIFVERLNPATIVCPAHYSDDPSTPDIPDAGVDRPTLPAILCDAIDPDCDKDGDGFPDPNSDCIEIPYIEKSMPPNGQFDEGVDIELVAMNVEGSSPDEDLFSYCKVGATLEEIPFPSAGCKKKLMRRWTINEWNDCAGEVLLRTCTQIIEVVDNEGPTVDVGPHDFEASTNGYDCEGYVKIPAVNFVDNCGDVKKVTVNIVDENGDPVHSISNFDYENGEFAPVPVGVNTVTYTAYDECHNPSTEDVVITVSDNTPPVAICDDHTVVSITYNGEAEVPASVFDDGSFDDCGINKFLARRMNPGCDCGDHYPKFPDMHYLGARSGHHYYVSKDEFIAAKAMKLSLAMGGYNARATGAERNWIRAQVLELKGLAPADIWINRNAENLEASIGSRFYVMEIEDACGFSAYTKFCCGDDVEMVVFRAVDKWGNYNDCMVEVEVQNKFPAVLECPTDVTVNCDVVVDTDDLGALFGVMKDNPDDRGRFLIRMRDLAYPMTYSGLWDGYAYNNCGLVDLDEDFVDNRDQCGRGEIHRTFTVRGTSQSCTQVISFERADDFLLTGITPPPAPPVIYDCLDLTENTKVSLDPAKYGRPTYDETSCDLVGINFEDDIFTFIDGQDDETCAKVIRTWTVIDWCAVDGATSAADYTSQPYTQIFKIIDKDAPVITGDCSDKSVVVSSANCDKTQVTMEMTANDGADGCTDSANLLWSVYYLENSDDPSNDQYVLAGSGNGNVNGAGDAIASFDEVLPYGTHTIKWEFSDQCGNRTGCDQVVTVVNSKAPTPYCITSLSVSLTNMNVGGQDVAMAVIWASDFATGENLHPCVADEDIMYSFSEDINDTSLEVTCCSVGNPVSVRVYSSIMVDGTPVQSFCNALLMVTDPEDLCNGFNTSGCTTGVTNAKVSGHVFTENNDMIQDVEIRLVGSELPPAATNDEGAYAFGGMPTGGDYVVDPKNDVDPMNGVSTLDLVIIQKHILGLDELDSPYKMIAADINMDSRVSTSDLVDLRKLILGIHEDFDENESWRFVNSDYTFVNPTNPLIEYFLEQYEISGLAQDMIVDFTAVKIGDVNSSATVNNLINAENRSNKTLSLVVDKVDFTVGQPVAIPVYSIDDQELLGMQFTAGFDTDLLEFVGVQSGAMALDPSNLGMQKADQGMMTMSWHTANKLSLDQDEPLFTMNFMAKSNGTTDQVLSINSRLTTAEAYESTAQVMDISLNFRDGQVIDTAYKLYQNTPNPFKESTVIGFDLPANEFVTIRVHDVTGKTITQMAGEYAKGFNQVSINKSSINATGVLYYTLEAETFTATKKMVILK